MDVNKTINKKKLFISILIVFSVFICLTSVVAQDSADANMTEASVDEVSQASGDLKVEIDESASEPTSNDNDLIISSPSDQKNTPQDKLGATNDNEPLGKIIPVTTHTFKAIRDAISGAQSGDTVYLESATYTGDDDRQISIINKKNIRIIGDSSILNAKGKSRIFYILNSNNVTIQNIIFENGQSTNGGAIYLSKCTDCSVSGCSFVKNTAVNGGGIYWSETNGGSVSNCSFVNNVAEYDGAFMLRYSSNANVSGCSFVNNTASENGGAFVWLETSNSVVSDCSFVKNTANGWGGAIGCGGGSNNHISKCLFVNNRATDSVIRLDGQQNSGNSLNINYNIFLDNYCPRVIYFVQRDKTSNTNFNWFGNNAINYSNDPSSPQETRDTWLFLNATVDSNTITISKPADITFELYIYNSTSKSTTRYADGSLLKPVNLTIAATKGNVNTTQVKLGDAIQFTPNSSGNARVTASIENVQYTIELEVVKYNLTLNATCNPIYYGDNATIIVTGFANAAGEARAYVGDGLYCATIVNGVATFTVPGVIENTTATVKYGGDDYYNNASTEVLIIVGPRDASVSVANDTMGLKVYSKDTIIATTAPGGLNVTFASNNESVATVGADGTVVAVSAGTAVITVSVGDGVSYAENSTTVTVTVSKVGSKVTIVPIDNVTYGEDVTIRYAIENRTGNVGFIVEDSEGSQLSDYNIIITDNAVSISGLDAGDYTITIINYADDKTKKSNASALFGISKFSPSLSLEVSDITYGEVEVITIKSDIPGTVNVTVNGITQTLELNGESKEILFAAFSNVLKSENKATLSLYNLKAGKYPVEVAYNGNENYEIVTKSDEFTVNSANASISADSSNIHVGDDETITVTLPDDATGNVTVEIDGVNYTEPVEDGKAVVPIHDLPAGDKTAKVYYSGDGNYNPSEITVSFTVSKVKPDVSAQDVSSDGKGHIAVILPEDATGTVTVEIDGKNHTAPVENGKAVFDIPGLSQGKHDIKVYYSGDDKYESVQFDASITIEGNETNPENKTVKTVDKVAMATGSTDETTGNPILMLLVALMAIGSTALRKLKK